MPKKKADIELDYKEFQLLYDSLKQTKKTSQMLAKGANKEQKKKLRSNLKIMKKIGVKLEKEGEKLDWMK